MGVKIVGYKDPEGLWTSYTNPGPRRSAPIVAGEIKYHYSKNGKEFDFGRYFVPGRLVGESVVDGNIKWRRSARDEELYVALDKDSFIKISWYKGRLHKGVMHREGKKDIRFDSMFGKYGLDYDNPETGHMYYDPKYSGSSNSNLSKEEAEREIYQVFVAPYADRIAEYTRVLNALPPIRWHRRKGEAWISPVLPMTFSFAATWIKKSLFKS